MNETPLSDGVERPRTPTSTAAPAEPLPTQRELQLTNELRSIERELENVRALRLREIQNLEKLLADERSSGYFFASFVQWVAALGWGGLGVVLVVTYVRRLFVNPLDFVSVVYVAVGLVFVLICALWARARQEP